MITDMILIDNHNIITCSADKSILKRNIENNKQVRTINAHNDIIYGIDYDKKNDIIFSCSKDNSIKLFN